MRYSEDLAVIRRREVVFGNANAGRSSQAGERHSEGPTARSALNVPAPATRSRRGRNVGPPDAGSAEDGREPFGTESIADLEEKAFSKYDLASVESTHWNILIRASVLRVDDFHALGTTLAYVTQPAFVYCPSHRAQQPYQDLSIEEKLHELSINIYDIAVEARDRNESHLARWILFDLVFALDQYRLFDTRKRNILLKIARMFQELRHPWHYAHVLLKIAGMYRGPALPTQEGPFHLLAESSHLLAESFPTSSMSIRRVLVNRWNETVGGIHVDSNLNVPPLHAAVQHRNPSIILALLSNPNDCSSTPLAPPLTMPSRVGQVRADIDERDLNSRTALFAAVANGDEPCCSALLYHGADANIRDDHGHTALEVAVRRGYLNIVDLLIYYKALVNPDITGCSSLPLHAAIESSDLSSNLQLRIIHRLLESGAEAYLRRHADNKHAIDLAVDRGEHELAESIRQRVPSLSQSHTPFMGQIIS